jgi:hypothetical protein
MYFQKLMFIVFAVMALGTLGCGDEGQEKMTSKDTSSALHEKQPGASTDVYQPSEPYAAPEAYTPTEAEAYRPPDAYVAPVPYPATEAYTPTEAYEPPEAYTPTDLEGSPKL